MAARRRIGWFRAPVFPTRRLAALVAIVGVLWLIPGAAGRFLAIVSLAAVLVAAVVDYLLLPNASGMVVERTVPERMGLGDPFEIQYRIRSGMARAMEVSVYDAIPPGIAATVSAAPFTLGPGEEASTQARAVAGRRGRHVFGPVSLRAESALGLLGTIIRTDLAAEIIVVPSLSNVRRLRLLSIQHRLSEAGVRALKQRGEGSAFAGLREYVPGDDPRLLDWKASARHARLITREQTIERSQTVLTLVDCGRAMTQLAGRYSRFEHVLSAAIVLTDVASSSGDRVGLLAFGEDIRAFASPEKGAAALRSVRTVLSGLDATMAEPDYAAAFRLLAARQRRRALLVLFTDVTDARAARSLLAYATHAVRRHLLLVVAIQNEELLAAARPVASGATALFRAAAAEELVREREETLARMRQLGVTVLDVPVTELATSVVNRYLKIKARGTL